MLCSIICDRFMLTVRSNLCDEFARLLKLMWDENASPNVSSSFKNARTRRTAINPSVVISPHAFAGAVAAVLPYFNERYEQQDAQEFLRVRTILYILNISTNSRAVRFGAYAK
jgi:hypothetical protein